MTSATQTRAERSRQGRLYLVPAPLDFGCDTQAPLDDVMPQGTLATTARLTHWICESAKSARAYLKRVDALAPLALPLQALQITELPHQIHKKGDHAGALGSGFDVRPLLGAALNGHDIGLLSEAGMPAVADPGSSVVRAAHDLDLEVVALTGPVSLLLALATSGLNGQNFAFVGYLPQDPAERGRRIRELEAMALKTGQTQLFIETPYRNAALLQALLQHLQNNTRLSVSSGLTLPRAQTRSQLVKAWRLQPVGPDNSTPAVFAIGR
ncbi:MAG: SAM-dependent methyltransferase [Burkholderiaceae bacterium]|jgi:16S rRNA (cytidine1402-2'-O)-methyltransferase|nr:SAM-dependent methyltransferase [Burkholderiaceae bacterium]